MILQAKIHSGEVIAIRGKDETPRVLFHNELKLSRSLDEKFKSIWSAQTIPVAADLDQLLAKGMTFYCLGFYLSAEAGLKSASVSKDATKSAIKAPNAAKTSRRYNRRIRITNTHIEGIDFSVDSPAYKK